MFRIIIFVFMLGLLLVLSGCASTDFGSKSSMEKMYGNIKIC